MEFTNRENPCHIVDDKEIWESRSIALHGILILRVIGDKDYVLLTKRSDKCPDEVGKYANVTGYLDWDESPSEGLIREYWEECHLDLERILYDGLLVFGDYKQPYYVAGNPEKDARQNVTLRYKMGILVTELPTISVSEETSEVRFVELSEAIKLIQDKNMFAWNHAQEIKNVLREFYKRMI